MTVEATPKSRIGFWPLIVCLFFNLPLLLVAVAQICGTLVPAKAESMDIFQFIAKVLFFCFLFGIPFAVVSALCSGLYLFFRFRRLSYDFRLYFACNCILPIILIYIAVGVLSGLSR